MQTLVEQFGFESAEEMNRMVAAVDLTTKENRHAFIAWQSSDGTKAGLEKLPTCGGSELPAANKRQIVRLPVSAVRMPFGSGMWFLSDAEGSNIAQIMPSGDEETCRELARLVNLGAACESNAQPAGETIQQLPNSDSTQTPQQ